MTAIRRATAVSLAALIVLFGANAASAGPVDDCILEKTFECLDDADFWDCYDFIVEDCQNQPRAIALPPTRLKAELANARQKAVLVYERHLATKRN